MMDDAHRNPEQALEDTRPAAPAPDDTQFAQVEQVSALTPEETETLTAGIVAALKTVYDPEIPADIYELGLIYKVDIDEARVVTVDMTLTTPNCPSAAELPAMVQDAVGSVPGVSEARVNVVWTPPWTQDRMSDEARVVLNMW